MSVAVSHRQEGALLPVFFVKTHFCTLNKNILTDIDYTWYIFQIIGKFIHF